MFQQRGDFILRELGHDKPTEFVIVTTQIDDRFLQRLQVVLLPRPALLRMLTVTFPATDLLLQDVVIGTTNVAVVATD